MSFWQILGRLAVSDEGKTIQRVSDTTSVSSDGTTHTRMCSTKVGSDGSTFTQIGSFSTDGSTRMGSTATLAWQWWESGKRIMPGGLWELFLIKSDIHPDYDRKE